MTPKELRAKSIERKLHYLGLDIGETPDFNEAFYAKHKLVIDAILGKGLKTVLYSYYHRKNVLSKILIRKRTPKKESTR